MRITATQLRRVIKEEVEQALEEADTDVSADTLSVIEDFVKTLRDADPNVTLGSIERELNAAFRRDKSNRTSSPEARAATRSAAGVKAAATRKARDAEFKAQRKKEGPMWPGELYGVEKPAGWKKSNYKWDEAEGNWVEK